MIGMFKKILLLLVSLAIGPNVVAAEPTQKPSVDWQAQWIWQAADGPDNSWVVFRKSVDVPEIPEKVIANIAADSKYWLWINGELVVFEGSVARGPSPARPWKRKKEMWNDPAQTKPSNTWYEEVDLTKHLRSGKNSIVALVWHWGRETHKGTHIDSGKGGFLFQADIAGKRLLSDASWKVKADPAYALHSGDPSDRIVQSNVKYDARQELGNWLSPDFPDTDWETATEKGIPPTAPWHNLEKNYVPALVNHGLKDYPSHPQSKFPFTSDGKTISCQLPFNKQVNPYLEVECDSGIEIKITTDNRTNNIDAFYTTKQGRQSFESYSWTNGHRVNYEIPAGVKVIGLKYRWMSVGKMAGSFECNDPFYQRLWWMGRNTLFVCARDNFMDCPDRERACWIGDVADQASYLFYCMDDAGRQLLKKAIYITMAYSDGGVYGALGPLRLRELPSQSLQFVDQGIWQYYFNTGDKETLRYAYRYVVDYLNLWTIGDDGLPHREGRSMDSWNWSDWGVKNTIDQKVVLDSLYFMALKSAKRMAIELDHDQDVVKFEKDIQTIKKAFNKTYWTGKFYSSQAKKLQDDRANCLTILSGLADQEKHDSIVNHVLIPNQFCSPHFEWMVEEAMCQAGFHDAALERMKSRYQLQVDRNWQSTLYEMFPQGGTYNHAWNAPNTILSKHIAGIAPTQPGWSEFQILPHLQKITSLKHVVPSVKGDITVDLEQTQNTFEIDLISPPGTTAIVGIPKSIGELSEIRSNDEVIWKNGQLLSSDHPVKLSGEDRHYVRLKLPWGTWKISASAK